MSGPADTAGADLKRSALGGFAWMSAGNGIRAVLKIAILGALGRLLSPADFGVVAAAGVVVWLGNIFASLGAGPALLQRKELRSEHIATGFATSLVLGIIMASAVYVLAPSISRLLGISELTPVLRWLVMIFPVAAISVVAECLLLRGLRFGVVSGVELAAYVGYGLVAVGLAIAGAGVWSLVAGELVKVAVKTAVFLRLVPHSITMRFDMPAFRELMRFGSGYTLGGLSVYVAAQADTVVVSRVLGATALGLYGRAYELMLVPSTALGTVLDKILLPTLSKVQGDPARLGLAYRRCTALVALLVLPLSAVTIAVAPEIIRTLLGPGWDGAVMPLRILAVGMYFRVGYMVGHSVANATGAVAGTAWRGAAFAAFVLLGALIGQFWGLAGVATGVVLAILANFLLALHLGVQITGTPWSVILASQLPAAVLALLLGTVAWVIGITLRSQGVSSMLILAAVGAVLAPTLVLLLRLFPRFVAGADGMWMIDTLWLSAPESVRPTLRRLLGGRA